MRKFVIYFTAIEEEGKTPRDELKEGENIYKREKT